MFFSRKHTSTFLHIGTNFTKNIEKIKKNKPEAIRFVSELQPVGDHKIVDSGTRLGFYIATADTYGELIELLELSE